MFPKHRKLYENWNDSEISKFVFGNGLKYSNNHTVFCIFKKSLVTDWKLIAIVLPIHLKVKTMKLMMKIATIVIWRLLEH